MLVWCKDRADIGLVLHKVHFKNENIIKFKGSLAYRVGGYVLETKNYKMSLEKFNQLIEV